MSGQLALLAPIGLTPIHSPMVTRPPSPSAAAAAADQQHPFGVEHPVAAGSSRGSPKSPAAAGHKAGKSWKSPPCCDGCGAAKASGGQCSGCHGRFCTACMTSAAASSLSSAGSSSGSYSSSAAGQAAEDKGACRNCSNLCNSCKPVACCFCEELRQQAGASRLCEACAGVCDACQRAACGLCRGEFTSCASCGYSACEDCRLQLQLQYGASGSADVGTLVGPSGAVSCWCAPPLRMSSNVRHVSSQRYMMAQLHPSFLACSMEAAGLRDYEDDDDSYEYDVTYGGEECDTFATAPGSLDADSHGSAHTELLRGGAAGNSSSSAGHHGRAPGCGQQGLGSMWMDPKALEVAIGSLPGIGGSHSLGLPLSPNGSSHSSAGVVGHVPGLAGVLGYAGSLRHQEHTLRGWLDGGC